MVLGADAAASGTEAATAGVGAAEAAAEGVDAADRGVLLVARPGATCPASNAPWGITARVLRVDTCT